MSWIFIPANEKQCERGKETASDFERLESRSAGARFFRDLWFGIARENEDSQVAEKDARARYKNGGDRVEYCVALARQSIPYASGRLGIEKVAAPAEEIRQINEYSSHPSKAAHDKCFSKAEYSLVQTMMTDVDVP